MNRRHYIGFISILTAVCCILAPVGTDARSKKKVEEKKEGKKLKQKLSKNPSLKSIRKKLIDNTQPQYEQKTNINDWFHPVRNSKYLRWIKTEEDLLHELQMEQYAWCKDNNASVPMWIYAHQLLLDSIDWDKCPEHIKHHKDQ